MIEPRLRHQHPRRAQGKPRLEPEPFGYAAPRPVLRLTHEPQRHGAPFHERTVSDQLAPASGVADDDRKAAGGLPSAGISGTGYPRHEGVERLPFPGSEHEVQGVRDETVGEQIERQRAQVFVEPAQEAAIMRRSDRLDVGGHQACREPEVAGTGPGRGHRVTSSFRVEASAVPAGWRSERE